jgi:hypothetical protein
MKALFTVLLTFPLLAAAQTRGPVEKARSPSMTISKAGSRPSRLGPAANFTGSVRVDPLFDPNAPSTVAGAYVAFKAGARSAWHSHPLGQRLEHQTPGVALREDPQISGLRGPTRRDLYALGRREHEDAGVIQ